MFYTGKSWTLLQFSFVYCIILDPRIYKVADRINEKHKVLWRFVAMREKENRNCHIYKKHQISELCIKEKLKLGQIKPYAGLSGLAKFLHFHEEMQKIK